MTKSVLAECTKRSLKNCSASKVQVLISQSAYKTGFHPTTDDYGMDKNCPPYSLHIQWYEQLIKT